MRARIAIYALLALVLWQAFVAHRQDLCIEQQRQLIRQLWRDKHVAIPQERKTRF
jgi:hypothetical protein